MIHEPAQRGESIEIGSVLWTTVLSHEQRLTSTATTTIDTAKRQHVAVNLRGVLCQICLLGSLAVLNVFYDGQMLDSCKQHSQMSLDGVYTTKSVAIEINTLFLL